MNLETNEDKNDDLQLQKFESMLKTNKVFFFDSEEFEDIIFYYLDNGKLNLAKKALKLALDQHPNSFGLKLVQVEVYLFEDKLDIAEKLVDQLYTIQPANEDIFLLKASIYSRKHFHEKAIENLKIGLKYTDEPAEFYSLLGMEYLFLDNLEEAKNNFILCLENDPEDHSALYNIVYCFDLLDQNNESIEFLNSYIDKNPYSDVAWHHLGKEYYYTKQYEKSVWAYNYAIDIDETFTGAYFEKGKSLEKLKKYDEALACYKTTLAIDDPSGYAYFRMGKCYNKQKDYENALKYFNKAIYEDPLLDKAWIAITKFYIKQKKYEKALFYLNSALEIDNENSKYWAIFAQVNIQLLFFDKAEFGFRKSFECGNLKFNNFILWVDTLNLLGEISLGLEVLAQATEVYENEYEFDYRLAGFHFLNNTTEKGIEFLEKALKIAPKKHKIIHDYFPQIFEIPIIQETINKYIK